MIVQTQAVILDLDGLLVDSEPLHQRAFNRFLAQRGVNYEFDEEEYGRQFVGIPVRANAERLVKRFGLNMSVDQVLSEREPIFQALIEDTANLAPMDGVFNVLNQLSARGIRLGLASGSPRRQVETMLRGLGIAERFAVVVAGTDVPRTKPAPDVYLKAIEELRVPREYCLAVEDSASGIAAAKAAGLRVIAVPNRFTRLQDLSHADATVDRLVQVLDFLHEKTSPVSKNR